MEIAPVEILEVGFEMTGSHTFVYLTSDSGVTGLEAIRWLGLPPWRPDVNWPVGEGFTAVKFDRSHPVMTTSRCRS